MKKSLTTWFTVCFFLICLNSLRAAPLQAELEALFTGQPLTVWSILVQDRVSGRTVFEIHPQRSLIPASNVKLPVCAAALLQLGPNFQYQTRLYRTGELSKGILQGNILIEGSGDPSISGRFHDGDITYSLREWADILEKRGIKKIQGHIIGIDDVFDDKPHGLNWNPLDFAEWYAAEVCALTFNDGCVDLRVQGASKSGKRARIEMNPPTDYVHVRSLVQTVRSRKSDRGIEIERNGNGKNIVLKGTIRTRRSNTVYASVPNPTLFMATVFQEVLQQKGIEVTGKALDGDDTTLPPRNQWELIHRHHSMPLVQLLNVCLKNSQNLYAEHFLKTLGYKQFGTGSWETGILAVMTILNEHGCELDGMYLADGSGLSRENRLSARMVVNLLRTMDRSRYADLFFDSLPQAGVSGTLKTRMKDSAAFQRVFAKTGTLNGVRSLSGLLKTNRGKTYFFSMIANATQQAGQLNDIMDKACALMVERG